MVMVVFFSRLPLLLRISQTTRYCLQTRNLPIRVFSKCIPTNELSRPPAFEFNLLLFFFFGRLNSDQHSCIHIDILITLAGPTTIFLEDKCFGKNSNFTRLVPQRCQAKGCRLVCNNNVIVSLEHTRRAGC